MKLGPYVEKLNVSTEFKQFSKKFSDAYMIAGFFIIDFETGRNIHQIDYYVPSKKKVAAFTLDGQISFQLLDLMNAKVPEELNLKTKVDLDQIKGILEDEMKNRSITDEIRKIIAVLQTIEGNKIWNLNCILTGMAILNAHIEDESRSVLKMEKKSFMDIVKKIPASQLRAPAKAEGSQGQTPQLTQKEAQEKLQKLEELQKEIQKEKEEIQKTTEKAPQINAKPQNSKAPTKKSNNKKK